MKTGWEYIQNQNIQGEKFAPNTLVENIFTDETERTNLKQLIGNFATPNLLINADPGLPHAVWNEGTALSGAAYITRYTAEMWRMYSTASWAVRKIENVGAEITVSAGSGAYFVNIVEKASFYVGKTLTLCVSINGVLYTVKGVCSTVFNEIATPYGSVYFAYVESTGNLHVEVFIRGGNIITLNWAHLAVGDVAINHVPDDPATNLMKCQRYYQKGDIANRGPYPDMWVQSLTGTFRDTPIFFSAPMRTSPTIMGGTIISWGGTTEIAMTRYASASISSFAAQTTGAIITAATRYYWKEPWIADARIY